LLIAFSTLRLLFGYQEEHPASKDIPSLISNVFFENFAAEAHCDALQGVFLDLIAGRGGGRPRVSDGGELLLPVFTIHTSRKYCKSNIQHPCELLGVIRSGSRGCCTKVGVLTSPGNIENSLMQYYRLIEVKLKLVVRTLPVFS